MGSLNQPRLNTIPHNPGRVEKVLLGGLAAGIFLYLFFLPVITSRWLDFPVYWEAGTKAVAGRTVYDVVGHFQYKYSPLVALLFGKALGAYSFETASAIFQRTMLLVWVALFVKFARKDTAVLFVSLLFFGNALRLDLELGQVNALVLYCLVLLFEALGRPRSWKEDVPFGVLFSLAVQLKLFALVLVPLLVFKREWRKLSLGLLFLPVLSVGLVAFEHGWSFAVAENRAWMSSLADSTDVLLLSEQNVAALGTFGKVFGLALGKLLWIAAGAGFLVYLWRNRTRPVEWFRDRLLYAIAIFNPLVWSYWILYALPLFGTYAREFAGAFRRRSIPIRVGGSLAALLVFAAFNGQHARWAWQGGIFAGLLLLGAAATKVRSHART